MLLTANRVGRLLAAEAFTYAKRAVSGSALCGRDVGLMLLSDFDDGVEIVGVMDGQFAEHFAIEFDAGLFECEDEAAVLNAPHAAGGRQAGDPQPAEIALARSTIAVGEAAGPDNRFLGRSVQLAATAAVSFDLAKQTFLSTMSGGARSGSGHDRSNSFKYQLSAISAFSVVNYPG